jgi:hypothetical protein
MKQKVGRTRRIAKVGERESTSDEMLLRKVRKRAP